MFKLISFLTEFDNFLEKSLAICKKTGYNTFSTSYDGGDEMEGLNYGISDF